MQSVTDEQRYMYYIPVDRPIPAGRRRFSCRFAPRVTDGRSACDARCRRRCRATDSSSCGRSPSSSDDLARSWQSRRDVVHDVRSPRAHRGRGRTVWRHRVRRRAEATRDRRAHRARRALARRARDRRSARVRLRRRGRRVGVLVALAAAHWIQPLLYGESAKDPVAYAVVSAIMIVVALVASVVPAARAARVDPEHRAAGRVIIAPQSPRRTTPARACATRGASAP